MLATDNTVVQQATVAVASAIGGMVIPVNARFLPSVAMAMAISVGAAAATIGAVTVVRPTFTSRAGRAVVRLDQKLLDSPGTHAATMTAAIMGGMSRRPSTLPSGLSHGACAWGSPCSHLCPSASCSARR